jgi:hypothetical protein
MFFPKDEDSCNPNIHRPEDLRFHLKIICLCDQVPRYHFLAYFPYFEKIEEAYEITLLSVCVPVCSPLSLLGYGPVKVPTSLLGNGSVKIPLSLLGND